jgi:hypothetical protein
VFSTYNYTIKACSIRTFCPILSLSVNVAYKSYVRLRKVNGHVSEKTPRLRLHTTVPGVELPWRQLRLNDTVRWEIQNEETADFSDFGDTGQQRRVQLLQTILQWPAGRSTLCAARLFDLPAG